MFAAAYECTANDEVMWRIIAQCKYGFNTVAAESLSVILLGYTGQRTLQYNRDIQYAESRL